MSSRPSKRGYLTGVALLVLGIAVAIAGVVFGSKKFVDDAGRADRHPLPATVGTQLKAGDDVVLVALAPTAADAKGVKATIVAPDGASVPLADDGDAPAGLGEIDGRQPSILGTFTAKKDGEYQVKATGPDTAMVAVSATTARDVAPWILGGMAGGAGLGILGIVVMVATAARRRRRARP